MVSLLGFQVLLRETCVTVSVVPLLFSQKHFMSSKSAQNKSERGSFHFSFCRSRPFSVPAECSARVCGGAEEELFPSLRVPRRAAPGGSHPWSWDEPRRGPLVLLRQERIPDGILVVFSRPQKLCKPCSGYLSSPASRPLGPFFKLQLSCCLLVFVQGILG